MLQKVAFQSMGDAAARICGISQTLSDGEAPGPVVVGEGEFGTSPPVCSGDSWVSAVPCSARVQPWLPSISLLISSALKTRLLNKGLMITH